MSKHRKRVGLKLSDETSANFEFMVFDETISGDKYIMPFPQLVGTSGFHISSHKSGEAHAKLVSPELKAYFPTVEQIKSNVTRILPKIIRLPEGNEEILLQIIDPKIMAAFKIEETKGNVSIEARAAFKSVALFPTYRINPKDFIKKIQSLRQEGTITSDKFVLIFQNENTGFYIPFDSEEAKQKTLFNSVFPISKESGKILEMVDGIIFVLYKEDIEEIITELFYPYGKHWLKILKEVGEVMNSSENAKELNNKIKSLAEEAIASRNGNIT